MDELETNFFLASKIFVLLFSYQIFVEHYFMGKKSEHTQRKSLKEIPPENLFNSPIQFTAWSSIENFYDKRVIHCPQKKTNWIMARFWFEGPSIFDLLSLLSYKNWKFKLRSLQETFRSLNKNNRMALEKRSWEFCNSKLVFRIIKLAFEVLWKTSEHRIGSKYERKLEI